MNKSAEELFLTQALNDNNINLNITNWHKVFEKKESRL